MKSIGRFFYLISSLITLCTSYLIGRLWEWVSEWHPLALLTATGFSLLMGVAVASAIIHGFNVGTFIFGVLMVAVFVMSTTALINLIKKKCFLKEF
jgi:hypothetical protein